MMSCVRPRLFLAPTRARLIRTQAARRGTAEVGDACLIAARFDRGAHPYRRRCVRVEPNLISGRVAAGPASSSASPLCRNASKGRSCQLRARVA